MNPCGIWLFGGVFLDFVCVCVLYWTVRNTGKVQSRQCLAKKLVSCAVCTLDSKEYY